MIKIRQRPIPRSRTQTGSLWEATAEIDGKSYFAVSRRGVPQALARMLVAANVTDQPVEVRSEVCVLDAGKEMRTEELRGCITYRSLHAMAKWTFTEGAATPLHRVRFQEQPEGVFSIEASGQEMRFTPPASILASTEQSEDLTAGGGTGQKCVSSPPDDVAVPVPTEPRQTRRCEGCDGDFLPARPWSRFCTPACRLRAHRAGAVSRSDQPGRGV
jgi:hypothetical protein